MTFTLPELPYAYDALGPYMSKETLEFHHDKHHKAYVDTGNKLLEGTDLAGKSVEEIVKASYNTNQALFNNAGQHYNHLHFWNWMKPNGGGQPRRRWPRRSTRISAATRSSRPTSSRPASASSAPAGPGSRSRTASSPS